MRQRQKIQKIGAVMLTPNALIAEFDFIETMERLKILHHGITAVKWLDGFDRDKDQYNEFAPIIEMCPLCQNDKKYHDDEDDELNEEEFDIFLERTIVDSEYKKEYEWYCCSECGCNFLVEGTTIIAYTDPQKEYTY